MGVIDFTKRERKIKAKPTLKAETRKTIRALIITLSIMILVLGGAFLAITTHGSERGYALAQAKLKNKNLKSEAASIKTNLTTTTSFTELESNSNVSQMTPLSDENKTYVTKEDNTVK